MVQVIAKFSMEEFSEGFYTGTGPTFEVGGYEGIRDNVRIQTVMREPRCVNCHGIPTIVHFEQTHPDHPPQFQFYGPAGVPPINKHTGVPKRIKNGGVRKNLLFTKDHVIPRSWGGSDEVENMQTMCTCCNRLKSDHYAGTKFNQYTYEQVMLGNIPWGGAFREDFEFPSLDEILAAAS